jgi:hypothetical protein
MSEEKAVIKVHREGEQQTGEMHCPERGLSLHTFAGKIQFRWASGQRTAVERMEQETARSSFATAVARRNCGGEEEQKEGS